MRKQFKSTLTILLGITLSIYFTGCSEPKGPKFNGFSKTKSNQGILYIYRPDSFGAMARNYYVYDLTSKQYIGDLENGVYLEYHTTQGQKHIAIYEKAPNAAQNTALIATNLLTPTFAAYGVSNKPDAIYPITVKNNSISCLKWDASYRGFNSLNGVVSKTTCAKALTNLKKVQ